METAVDEISRWFYEKRADEAIKNLIKHGFEAIKVHTVAGAVDEVMRHISPTQTVGAGGSVTLREIGVLEKLQGQGNLIYDHWKQGLGEEDSLRVRRLQQSCDVFLTGANAVTLSGEIVNIDGFGNRIASLVFGPKVVMIIAGYNKLVRDIPEAIHRIKTVAAPMNARRFGADTPCARLGECMDCDSPQRICRGTLILERRPFATPTYVTLVMEDLGY